MEFNNSVVLCCALTPLDLKAIQGISTLKHGTNLLPCLHLTLEGNRDAHFPIVTFSGKSLPELKKVVFDHLENVFKIMEEGQNEHNATV